MSYFQLYKPTQGKYVRWGTVAALALVIGLGMAWSYNLLVNYGEVAQTVGMVIFAAAGAVVTFLLVNRPRTAEFMIMTESEMRKVNWPSRLVVTNSTKVVIFLTFVIAFMLFVVDRGFIQLFHAIGILTATK